MKRIGVLALQGAVQEHLDALNQLPNVVGRPVKTAEDIGRADGLILPGGESTAMGKLLDRSGLLMPLGQKIALGLPVWGTCAGMILLAKKIEGQETAYLAAMDATVRRNAYGGQLDSFRTQIRLPLSARPVPLVFIRAPYITAAADTVRVLAKVDGKIVAAEQNHILVTSFHPELTDDLSFHRYFAEKFL